jgi:hypothetical protein
MENRIKSFLLGLFSGIVAYGVNAGMDQLNEREPDFTLYAINFFLWLIIRKLSNYWSFKVKKMLPK